MILKKGQYTPYIYWFLKQLFLFNVCNLETKTGFGKAMKKIAGCGIFVKKELPSFQTLITRARSERDIC